MTGYTARQADAQKRKIDRAIARAEDAVAALMHVLPDTSVSVVTLQEEIREIGHKLQATVDRRTRDRKWLDRSERHA